jgi:hypothetical protein
MSYNLTPMTEEELNAYDLIEEGIYDFEVLRSDKQTSKNGNAMAKVQLNVWDKEGKSVVVFDYLVFSNIKFCVKKIKHFCESTGIGDDYLKGNIREEFQGLCGKVSIGIQESLPNQSGGYYPAKNVVIDYITKDNASPLEANKVEIKQDEFNDELPF